MEHPQDWNAIKRAVHLRDRERCANCRADGANVTLDVHHIVPRGNGGSNRMTNLILLCRRCHDAAHGKRMAPVVKFHSNGSMTSDEFSAFKQFWQEFDEARFEADGGYWYVPKADMDLVTDQFAS